VLIETRPCARWSASKLLRTVCLGSVRAVNLMCPGMVKANGYKGLCQAVTIKVIETVVVVYTAFVANIANMASIASIIN
jgi:hypothetical protein